MLLWASLYHVIGIENSRHVLNQSDVLLNTIATWLATFPRAWSRLHVLTSSSHSRCFSFPVLFGLAVPFATVWVYNTQLESSLNACATETIDPQQSLPRTTETTIFEHTCGPPGPLSPFSPLGPGTPFEVRIKIIQYFTSWWMKKHPQRFHCVEF